MEDSVFNPTETPTPTETATPADPRATLAAAGLATTGPNRIELEEIAQPISDGPTADDRAHLTDEQLAAGWYWAYGRPHRAFELGRDRERRWVIRARAELAAALAARGATEVEVWVRSRRRIETRRVVRYGASFHTVHGHALSYIYVRGERAMAAPPEGVVARPCAQCGRGRRYLEPAPDRHGTVGMICIPCTCLYDADRDYTDRAA